VETRAKLSIVQLLADAYPAACFVQDVDGKTPLILVCDSSSALFENHCQETIWDPPSIDLIRTFIKAFPTSLSLEDNDGTSALEHAILSEVSIEVVRVLQHAPAFMCARTVDLLSKPLKVDEAGRTIRGTLS
jgi:hypothetical protein